MKLFLPVSGRFLSIILTSFLSVNYSVKADAPSLAPADLALAFPMNSLQLPSPAWTLAKDQELFPEAWFQVINKAFYETSIGTALDEESPLETWRVVSMRIAPCNPLGTYPGDEIDELCWPEVRLVWQSIQRKTRLHERFMEAGADDRGFHATYRVDASRLLTPAESGRVRAYLQAIASAEKARDALNAAAKADFIQLRNRVVLQLKQDTLALRSQNRSQADYQQLDGRVEMSSPAEEQEFFSRLRDFFGKYATPSSLQQMTAFSLPAGREPAHLDEWVFLSFKVEAMRLVPEPILIRSAKDGRILTEMNSAIRGSMLRDDDKLYDFLELADSSVVEELKDSVMLFENDLKRLKTPVSDRQQLLIANTSCISCHKLNDMRFDFHNYSYFEDRELTVSPRVVRDVELDLEWLKKQGF